MTSLAARNVTVLRNGSAILGDVDASFDAGEFVGLLGPNGAGKSTLLRCLSGLERPASGVCTVRGLSVSTLSSQDRARRIAYLPQLREAHWNVDVAHLAGLGRFAFGAPAALTKEDASAVERALAAADVEKFAARPIQSLSGGEQARAHLARALAAEAPILLADEPVAALDPKHQLGIMRLLKQLAADGRLVIAALHDVDLALQFCTRIVLLKDGRIAADGAPGAVLNPEMLRDVFSVEARKVDADGETFVRFFAL